MGRFADFRLRLDIKPLSVNECWKGKRYRTDSYKTYQLHISYLLRPMEIPEGPLLLNLEWGFSSAASDIDNPWKPFMDCLQKKYGFNDSRVHKATLEKFKVPKGSEYIDFTIEAYLG